MESGADLLRQLSACDENSQRGVLALAPERVGVVRDSLTPKVRMLVRIAALVALDASTTSLKWAVERASSARANDDEIAGVLLAIGADIGSCQLVASAPRLALSMGYDVEVDGWDGT